MPMRNGNILASGDENITQFVIPDIAKKRINPATTLTQDKNCDIVLSSL
jgi:hypothetical protein